MSILKKAINRVRDIIFGKKDPFSMPKNSKFFEPGYVWAPYVPLFMTPNLSMTSSPSPSIRINEEPPKNPRKWKKGYMYKTWNKIGTSTALYAFKPNYRGKFKEIPEVVQIGKVNNGDNVMFIEFKVLPTVKTVNLTGNIDFIDDENSLSYLDLESKKDWYYKVIHNDQVGYIIGTYTDLKRITPKMVEKQDRKIQIKELQKQEELENNKICYSSSKLRKDYFATIRIV